MHPREYINMSTPDVSLYQRFCRGMTASIDDVSGKAFDYIVIGKLQKSLPEIRSTDELIYHRRRRESTGNMLYEHLYMDYVE